MAAGLPFTARQKPREEVRRELIGAEGRSQLLTSFIWSTGKEDRGWKERENLSLTPKLAIPHHSLITIRMLFTPSVHSLADSTEGSKMPK